jgi:hypothetical protein
MLRKLASFFVLLSVTVHAEGDDKLAIRQAVLDYIESQHSPDADRMDRALHKDMKKRTFWRDKDGKDFLMETSRDVMLEVARTYNKSGEQFPANPRKEIQIFDIDGRTASVKLTADDWIDLMHLIKLETGEWKIVNVLWQ